MKSNLNSTFSNKRVLITGHTGFKGSWLSAWLNLLGANVYGYSIDTPTTPCHFDVAKLNTIISDFRADICDYNVLSKYIVDTQPDFIFHLAAQPLVKASYDNPILTWQTNTMGTLNVLESLKLLKKKCVVIFITSDKCYDNVEWIWGYKETDSLGGPDPYSASKGAAELVIKSSIKSFFPKYSNIKIGIGRAGNVIGGGDWALDRIVPDCITACSLNKIVELRNPKATRPWQHVLEPLSGYLNLAYKLNLDDSFHGEPFNFGPPANQNNSVGELVVEMSKYWNNIKWKDVSSNYGGPYESGLLKLNCDKALHYLKWKAIWDFETTIKNTVMWYKSYYEDNVDMKKLTENQINSYMSQAVQLNLEWAK
jgi:CDP-glucose 4,6-dehydratase